MSENLLLIRRRAAVAQARSSSEALSDSQGLRPAQALLQSGAWISPAPEHADLEGELEALDVAIARAYDRQATDCDDACAGESDIIEPDDSEQLWKTRSGEIDVHVVTTPLVESGFDVLAGWLAPHMGGATNTVASWETSIRSGLAGATTRWS